MVTVASWNVNSLRVRLAQVLDWLANHGPDIVCLQETKVQDRDFPDQPFQELGYHAVYRGQPSYNGMATLSRVPLQQVCPRLPGDDEDRQQRFLAATIGSIRVVNVYVPNGQATGTDKYRYKLEWMTRLATWLQRERRRYPQLLVMGDFNIAPEDRDVHDPQAWQGRVLCSVPERAALEVLLQDGMTDTFRVFEQSAGSFSWWDYRANAFARNAGLRIDLILASEALAKRCSRAWIDRSPRAAERPSDHAPIVAEFALPDR